MKSGTNHLNNGLQWRSQARVDPSSILVVDVVN